MQCIRQAARLLAKNANSARNMTTKTAEEYWAPVFPKLPKPSPEQTSHSVRKEMIGFLLLGPIGGGLMVYDFIYGLEEHSDDLIPPYPWLRIRRVPGMPWGEDALFEYHRYVASEWPLPEGHDGKVHAHDHH
ncbi:hypothetical protein CEUSTIGMA_g8348.t1 [Chlamydomonas eustigma]|uniref:Uncharacterized protein n=1 Tax=Chlamydomonas eustigma TaxID=1157962 RepID=A0A250XCU8_9CHLO|nr:hypothetical protein CEUSTIGMA_g8348.t1 [Chlamydomonas eustigma]|eukprot:GAX80913.1 hypothetical protein CEUSTIGMA_g8348.t1 [Chlamydomonas eustigma]